MIPPRRAAFQGERRIMGFKHQPIFADVPGETAVINGDGMQNKRRGPGDPHFRVILTHPVNPCVTSTAPGRLHGGVCGKWAAAARNK